MKPCLLTRTRRKYAEMHPDRDTRAMGMDDTFLAFAGVVEEELDRLRERQDRLERKLTTGDPE